MVEHPYTERLATELPLRFSARMRSLSFLQRLVVLVVLGSFGASLWWQRDVTLSLVMVATQIGFLILAAFRIVLVIVSRQRSDAPVEDSHPLPVYTILAALHDEADIVPQLIRRLAAIDYPQDRLQGMLLIEAHDTPTLTAAESAPRPDWLEVVIVPPGDPMTKPRALNHDLRLSTGDLLTVYDAEDHPDPGQLREAAARFSDSPDSRLACLQAPLRISAPHETSRDSAFLHRQFAVEYASLFEVTLPGLARLGMPFPLGGTSNHFRIDVLRAAGGWDPFNVTEDADLGFRLWRQGWHLGIMTRPTHEVPPNALKDWLPQRTRWLKGFMQTWGVHTRTLSGLGFAGLVALTVTIGGTLASAGLHALAVSWLLATVMISLLAGLPPIPPAFAVSVMILGTAAAWLSGQIGARRAGVPYSANDMIMSPIYWSLMSLAFAHAVWRLVVEPFTWDKTPHRPDPVTFDVHCVHAGRQVV
ncbi:glycosyltransferase family 2 protein [Brevundimonas variabilis]|nr:glycosyltransferase family 2 protein [Brevundimonas variabilis]